MNDVSPIPSDRALIAATRDGSDAAWTEFVARHSHAVHAVAAATGGDAEARTERAFDDLRTALVGENDGTDATDEPAVRAMRARAIATLTGGVYGPVASSDPTDDDAAITSELPALADAYARLPESWQTVLWHHYVEHSPAAELTAQLGRNPAAIVALRSTAERGLFDAYCSVVAHGDPPPLAGCRPIITQLGGYRRGTLPAAQARAVSEHLTGRARVGIEISDADDVDDAASRLPGCAQCRRRLAVAGTLGDLLAPAIVPALTGVTVEVYRAAVGAPAAIGASALAELRSERASRRTRAAAVAAVVLALLAAAFFIRSPFDGLRPDLAEVIEAASGSTLPERPATTDGAGPSSTAPSRIVLVFPSAPRGAVYVPGGRALDLSIELSTPGPVLAGGSGVVDADITNLDTAAVSTTFYVQVTSGVVFEELAEGDGSCRAEADDGATCAITIGPGDTISMALQFRFDADLPDRLVVDPGVASPPLEVPVEFVPDLLVGLVGRVESEIVGGSLGPCRRSTECPDGSRNASSATLDLAPGAEVEMALLVWDGPNATRRWSQGVGLIVPGGTDAQVVDRSEIEPIRTSGPASFRSTADVTAAVRAGGAGRYTVVRPPDARGPGSWTLVVVASAPSMPRRLVVVTTPTTPATPDSPIAVDVPVVGSVAPVGPRTAELSVHGWTTTTAGSESLAVGEATVGGDDPFGVRDDGPAAGGVRSYDREIASTEDDLPIVASTTDGALRVTAIGVMLDVAS